jgi:hypothetical protein
MNNNNQNRDSSRTRSGHNNITSSSTSFSHTISIPSNLSSTSKILKKSIFLVFIITCFYLIVNPNSIFEETIRTNNVLIDSNNNLQDLNIKSPIINGYKCLSKNKYTIIKESIEKSKKEIWDNWDITNFPLFLNFMHIPRHSWDIQKHKFIKLILEEKYSNSSFVVGFAGSSVTAGHDSYFQEAYPQIFYNSMKSVMSTLNVKFEVRNHGLGNNPCYPYDSCIPTHMGDDLDILTWEQSMNCGRDSKPLESFTRSAIRMRKSPTVMYILSGTPAWKPEDCVNISSNSKPPNTSFHDSNLNSKITPKDMKYRADLSKHMYEMSFLNVNSKSIVNEYNGVAPMGQNVLGLDAYKCQGPYSADFSVKTPGGGVEWHPGAKGHTLRGENIAFSMLSILQDAIDEIGANIDENRNDDVLPRSLLNQQLRKKDDDKRKLDLVTYRKKSINLWTETNLYLANNTYPTVIPPIQPMSCRSEVCSSEPFCFTDYQPRMKDSLTTRLVGNTNVISNINTPILTNSESIESNQIFADSIANIATTTTNTVLKDRSNNLEKISSNFLNQSSWSLEISFFDKNAVLKSESKGLGYRDRKYLYISHSINSSISFYVTLTKPSIILLCECQKGFLQYPSYMGDLDNDSQAYIQYNVKENMARDVNFIPEKNNKISLSLSTDQCYKTIIIPTGSHVITIEQKGEKQINIGYLVYW